ncbi:MAG: NAD(P)-dependent oxidoreductase [Roseovarius sp.]
MQDSPAPASRPQGATLLVTGATGFLGRAVMARARAWGLRAVPAPRALFGAARGFAEFLDEVQPSHAIDAAGILPGRGDVAGNVALTRCWIEALGQARAAPRLVLTGSAAVYGSGAAPDRATREDDPMRPVSDYGRAKLAALELGREAHARAGHDIQTGIVFNLIGAGQAPHMAPRVFIERALAARGGTFEVGQVDAVRDFMDIEDAAEALIALALRGRAGEICNVATGRPTRIGDLLDAIGAATGAGWESGSAGEGSADICYGDPARLVAQTGWQPRHDFETALARAIAAVRANRGAEAER